jgi:hypothetical protein
LALGTSCGVADGDAPADARCARGLRRPEAQVPIYDDAGNLVGRPDLYYPQDRLGLEYDGGTHRLTLAEDNRRQNRLLDAGVRLLRFTAADIYDSPETVVALVRAQLNRSVHTTNRKPASGSEIVHTTVRA